MNMDLRRRCRRSTALLLAMMGALLSGCAAPPERKEARPAEVAATQPSPKPSVPDQPASEAVTQTMPQIQEVAVIQRPGNRTRLVIATDRKANFDVSLNGTTLLVDMKRGTLRPDLMRTIEPEHASGAIKRVQPQYSAEDHRVLLHVMLRQLIPYHISREETKLTLDFDPVAMERAPWPRPESLMQSPGVQNPPLPPVQASPPQNAAEPKRPPAPSSKGSDDRAGMFEATSRQYAGQKMSFDFVDADIRNILQLISEVAGINIVWGSDVEGKISMKLDNVPWDQALEMVLRPNGLTYQIEDNVLWVVPKEKLRDLEIKEGKRKGALMAAKRLQGVFEAKIVEFITIRHRKASDIFKMLVGDKNSVPPIPPALDIEGAESEESEEGEQEKGKKVKIATMDLYLSFDPGTNTIIANGVRAKVDKVKELIAKLDIPEKQILIEARIVEATTGFTRNLGIEWQSGFKADWINTGSSSTGSTSFTTNAPGNWASNIGLNFGWLTGGGLGAISLDAKLALGETDNKAHIISAPKVLTVNGGEAFISRGTVEYFPVSTQNTIDYKEIAALLSLKVNPTVSADNSHVTMKIEVTDDKAQPASKKSSSGGEESESPPGRATKSIKSTLMVRTGDTVVIGGIYRESQDLADSGVPWLKDIPFLGWLFKAERENKERTELLIFLTPSVVNPLGTAGG